MKSVPMCIVSQEGDRASVVMSCKADAVAVAAVVLKDVLGRGASLRDVLRFMRTLPDCSEIQHRPMPVVLLGGGE